MKDGGLLSENLKTLPGALHDEDPALVIHLYRDRTVEQFLAGLPA